MNREMIIRALARGYTHDINKDKVVDPDLITAMADELLKVDLCQTGE